jgi:hypothetical protein
MKKVLENVGQWNMEIFRTPDNVIFKDFYNQPKPTIDRFNGKARNWI